MVLPTDGLFIGHCQLFVALQFLTQLTQLIHMSVCVCGVENMLAASSTTNIKG